MLHCKGLTVKRTSSGEGLLRLAVPPNQTAQGTPCPARRPTLGVALLNLKT